MDFFDAVKKRRSVRAYQPQHIEEGLVRRVLEAAIAAPSAGNLQAYEIVAVEDADKKKALAAAAHGQSFVAEAPIVLVFCARPGHSAQKYGERGKTIYAVQDATIAASYAQLAATAQGLATCWVGAFSEKDVLSVIGKPQDIMPVCMLPLGYPAEQPRQTSRRTVGQAVRRL
jgi:nitroreductase